MSSIWRKTNRDRKELFNDIGDLMEAAGALDWLGLRDAPVVLKPNLVVSKPASGGATTTPAIAEGVIRYLRDGGYERIVIAEGSWVGDSTSRAFKVCGYSELSRRYDALLVDLQKDEAVSYETEEGRFLVCRTIAELEERGGSLINLPLVKGHGQTRLTCALKNLKGCIPDSEKRRYHSRGVHSPVARLNTLVKPSFVLADGLNPDPGWEEGGSPVRRDLLLLGKDPVALDRYAARLLGLADGDVDYIGLAEKLGVGTGGIGDRDVIDLDGTAAADLGLSADNMRTQRDAIERVVDQRAACSACFGHLASVLRRWDGPFPWGDKSLCIGQDFKARTLALPLIGIGSCTAGSRCLKGCPPSQGEIEAFLKTLS